MADQFDDRYSSPDAVRLAKSLAMPLPKKVAGPSRRAATPAMFAQNAYYPEDENRDAERQRLLENNFMDYYRQNLSPEAIRKLTFEYARNELGMSERDAAIQADHAASTATRTGYIADATALAPLAGGAVNFGREAVNTARAMAAPRAAEAVAPRTLALPPPSPGPSSPIGRGLSGETIEAGRPPVNIAEDYRLSSQQNPRIGPNRPPEARNPVIDETYTIPEQLNQRPLTTTRSSMARIGDEGPQADRVLAARQQAGRDAEAAFRARQEAINADEGYGIPMIQRDKDFAQFQRELAAIEERGAGAQFAPPSPAGEVRSPLLDMPAPGVKRRLTPAAEPAPAQPTFDFGGPQSVGGQMVDPLTGRAYMPRQFPQTAPQSATGSFSPVIQGQASPTNAYVENAIKIAKQRSDAMARTAADAAAQQNAIDAAALQVKGERARGPYQRSQSADSLIDDAIADATGDVSRQSAIDRAKQRLAAQSAAEEAPAVARPAAAGEAPAAAAPAEKAFSAANVAELRANGFNELADQVEAVLAKNAQAAAAPAAAATAPAAVAPAAAAALPPLGGRLANGLLGAGTVGAGGLAVATADRNERRLQKALAAAQSSQKITDMDEAALNVVRGGEDAPDSLDYLKGRLPAVSTPATVKSTPDWLDDYINRPRPAQTQSQPPAGTPATRSPPAQMPTAPAGGGSFLDKIFSGKDYQSSGGQLQRQEGGNRVLNWGDSDNAADFFRADAMRKRMEDQQQQYTGRSGSDLDYESRMRAGQGESEGKARGGAAEQKPSKEAMLHKSLEIIHHMIKNR
jgi:hypothetical protein